MTDTSNFEGKEKRVIIGTNLDPELKRQFKVYCAMNEVDQNELIENYLLKLFSDSGEMVERLKSIEVPKVKRVVYSTSFYPDIKRQFNVFCVVNGLKQYVVIEDFIRNLLVEEGEGDGNSN